MNESRAARNNRRLSTISSPQLSWRPETTPRWRLVFRHRFGGRRRSSSPVTASRCLRDGMVGNAPAVQASENPLAPGHAYGSPASRIPSRWAKNDTHEEGSARESACRPRGARARYASSRSLGMPRVRAQERAELALELSSQRRERRLGRLRLHMHHDIDRRQGGTRRPAPEDLADSPLDALTHHRAADLAARGDTQAWRRDLIGMNVQDGEATVALASAPVAALKLASPVEAVAPPEGLRSIGHALSAGTAVSDALIHGRGRPQTARRLRPLRRRRERTARP